jgi:hypothetical protein
MAKSKTQDPELEINAKLKNGGDMKEWGKKFKSDKKNKKKGGGDSGGMLYFVGFVGSVVYWMQAAVGFGAVVTAVLKSMIWPAYIVYKLLENFYGIAS